MEIRQKRHGNASVIALVGSLDTRSVMEARGHLLAAVLANPRIVLDLSKLEYLSSAGVAAFVMVARQAKAHGGALRLACLQPKVKETLTILRLDSGEQIFQVFATVKEAVKDF